MSLICSLRVVSILLVAPYSLSDFLTVGVAVFVVFGTQTVRVLSYPDVALITNRFLTSGRPSGMGLLATEGIARTIA